MPWRYHGRAQVDPINPHAFAICDRCGFLYNHVDLNWQFQWIGPQLQNLRILVCRTCMDDPQEQLRTIILPPDPLPIWNSRPPQRELLEIDYLTAHNGSRIIGQNSSFIVKQPETNVGEY